jgi:LPPG:FO 2-phospho-L-lactate transferase
VKDETWQAMAMLRLLGEADWFNLGDRDMAMHIARSWRRGTGASLSAVTARLTAQLGIDHPIVPMSDAPVRTQVDTAEGWLDFQRYFVSEQCRPKVSAMRFNGALAAVPAPPFAAALARTDLSAIVICPSNPYLSIDPILALGGVRDTLSARSVPLVVVSPLVGRTSAKGPLAKLMGELGKPVTNLSIAEHYQGLLDHIVIDQSDAEDAQALRARGLGVTVTPTMMHDAADRERLARATLAAVQACG